MRNKGKKKRKACNADKMHAKHQQFEFVCNDFEVYVDDE